MTPAYSPAVYDTPEFRAQLTRAVIARLRDWQGDKEELLQLVEVVQLLEAVPTPQHGAP
ncbi:hypothetical protein ACH427_04290 [Streptomyces sp. NPDC020379]|uniref:hypothetical protein n=1 Tax=Streptomyces sp. NPDC020379 TaxID=3365071 RepID=UPI00378B0468